MVALGWLLAALMLIPASLPGVQQSLRQIERSLGLCGPAPTTAAGYDAAFSNRTNGWLRGDLIDSVLLPDGRRVWIFGDTFMGSLTPEGALENPGRFVHSSAIIQTGDCFTPVEGHAGGAWVFWPFADGSYLWPLSAMVRGDELIVTTVRVRTVPDGTFGLAFEEVGGAAAVFSLDDLTTPTRLVTELPAIDGQPFAFDPVVVDDHVISYRHNQQTGTWAARVAVADYPGSPDAWTYWDGTEWVDNIAHAAPVAPVPMRISVDAAGAVEGLHISFGASELDAFAGASAVGPFASVGPAVGLGNYWPAADAWGYQPVVHEGIVLRSDERLVSFNTLPFASSDVTADPSTYGPRFLPRPMR